MLFVPSNEESSPIRMKWVRLASGAIVYYREAGQGPPLVLVHGWGGSSRYWMETMRDLADVRTMYALDMPGHGESSPFTGSITPRRLAQVIVDFADALHLESFDLNGHSYSSSVAAFVGTHWPERVDRLILTCGSVYRNERERRLVNFVHRIAGMWVMLRQPWMSRVQRFYKQIARMLFYSHVDDQRVRDSVEDFLRMDRHTGIQIPLNAGRMDYLTILRNVVAPTLIIGARRDSIMPAYGPPTLARLIPDSSLHWIENCGHIPMIERPHIYHQILHDFLTGKM